MISQIYDPLGLAAPFLLKGKIILQDLHQNNYSWDDIVPSNFIKDWESCKVQLHLLENVVMKMFQTTRLCQISCCSLHHFSDASQDGYGQVSYLWLVNEKGSIPCCLVMGKWRVAPTKFVSIPRFELTAAALSVKVSILLRKLTSTPLSTNTSIMIDRWYLDT